MFLTKLLVGNAIEMNRDESAQKAAERRALTVPPPLVSTFRTTPSNSNTNGTLKYNTVTGHTGGSQVWIVYENGRAYPEYLVRYYKGTQRDTNRTRFATRDEARRCSITSTTKHGGAFNDNNGLVDLECGSSSSHTEVVWEYMDGGVTNGWKAYSAPHTAILEAAYQLYIVDRTNHNQTVDICTPNWAYRIDLATMVQTSWTTFFKLGLSH
jgi:WWE domain